jgi:signal transduction histidine kinase
MAVGVFIDDAIAASIAAYVANRDHHVRDLERAAREALHDVQVHKDEFLAVIVHELRNPIAPIVNAAEALGLMLGNADGPSQHAVQLIKRQSRHLTRILDDLTDLTRVALGRLTLRRGIVDVTDVVEQAMQTTAALMSERGHQWDTEIDAGPLRVEGDSTRLVQVVVNLLVNAAKYTPSGGRVKIAVRRASERIEIAVRDNGQGIPPELLEKVFDMYARLSESAETAPDGLGVGLALVKELVALHGGSVVATSDGPGRGAEFVVALPAYTGLEGVTRDTPQPTPLTS